MSDSPIIKNLQLLEKNSEEIIELAKRVFEPLKNVYFYRKISGILWWKKITECPVEIIYEYRGQDVVEVSIICGNIQVFDSNIPREVRFLVIKEELDNLLSGCTRHDRILNKIFIHCNKYCKRLE